MFANFFGGEVGKWSIADARNALIRSYGRIVKQLESRYVAAVHAVFAVGTLGENWAG